jgi:hypothetical protein
MDSGKQHQRGGEAMTADGKPIEGLDDCANGRGERKADEGMTMTKHTPGPWAFYRDDKYCGGGYDYHVHQAGETGEANCYTVGAHVVTIKDVGGGKVHEANARLIAASPTLYSLVQRAALFLEMNGTQRVALVEDCKSTLDSLNTIK